MKVIDIIAVCVGVALVFSLAEIGVTSASDLRSVNPYVPPRSPVPPPQPYFVSILLNIIELMQNNTLPNLTSVYVNQAVGMLMDSPIVRQNPLLMEMMQMVNQTYSLLYSSYHRYRLAEDYLSDGAYGLAVYYANTSYVQASQALDLLTSVDELVAKLSGVLGPQGVAAAQQLVRRAIGVAEGLEGLDQLVISEATQHMASHIPGNLSVVLSLPPEVWLGQTVNVSGEVLVNGSKQASMGVVSVGVLGWPADLVQADSEGHFWVTINTVYNQSGQECIVARPDPIGSYLGDPSKVSVVCVALEYYQVSIQATASPSIIKPGNSVYISGSYIAPPACSPQWVTICFYGSCSSVEIVNRSFHYVMAAPPSPGEYTLSVAAPQAGACAPATTMLTINVTPYPTDLRAWAPSVWVGLLPLPIKGSVRGPSAPSPWDHIVLEYGKSTGSTYAGPDGHFTYYLDSPAWGTLTVVVYAYPSNVSLSPSQAQVQVALIPAPIIIVAVAGGGSLWLLTRVRGRGIDKTRHGSDKPSRVGPKNSDTHLDGDLALAWSALERSAGVTEYESNYMTARELAKSARDKGWALRLAYLIEKGAYGPGLTASEREELRSLLSRGAGA